MCSDFYLKDSGALKKNEMKNEKVKKSREKGQEEGLKEEKKNGGK